MLLIDTKGTAYETTLSKLLTQSPYTLLYFYPKDNTPGCTTEAQDFTKLKDAFNQLNIHIIGVSKDSEQSHCKFIEKYNLAIPLLSDPELILHKQFGARGEKNNYGKIVTGVIRSTFLLDQKGNELHAWRNIRAKGHAERVLRFVHEYFANPPKHA